MFLKNYFKKEYFLLLSLFCFHLTANFFFLKQDTSLLFQGTPHYMLNIHLKTILGLISPWPNDLLFFTSWSLTKLCGYSLLALRLSPTLALFVLMGVIYYLVRYLTNNKSIALFSVCLVSFTPGILIYSRLYSHQLFFIALIYAAIYFSLKFFFHGYYLSFIFYVLTVSAGSSLFKDGTCLELLFLLYVSGSLIYLLKYLIANRRLFKRYFLLISVFITAALNKIYLISFERFVSYYLRSGFGQVVYWENGGFERFPYPDTLRGWIVFFIFYIGDIVSSVFLLPFIVFLLALGYLLYLKKKQKIPANFKVFTLSGSLFFPFLVLSIFSKKQVIYVSPLLPLIGIISAAGILLINSRKLKLAGISFLLIINFVSFSGPFFDYKLSSIAGSKLSKTYSQFIKKYRKYELCGNLWDNLLAYYFKKTDYLTKKAEIYLNLAGAKNLNKSQLFKQIKAGESKAGLDIPGKGDYPELAEELAVLEYVLDYRLYSQG